MRSKQSFRCFVLTVFSAFLFAQVVPDLGEFKTLKCDLHMHTVFSDGLVWPTLRIDEALDEGLDVISVTDHLEYQPHKKNVSTDRNIANRIAAPYAKRKGIIFIPGVEITRWMPPGHLNALFIEDANKLMQDDFLTVIEEAIDQGAFIFWNHPGWVVHQPDKVVRWYDVHQTLVDRGWLHGIEFVNTHEYYRASAGLAKEHGLALLGNSDVHGMVHREFLQKHSHRPLTLVFAAEKNADAVKEALFARRTIALSEDNIMAGPEMLTRDFIMACLETAANEDGSLSINNISGIPFIFSRSDKVFHTLAPHEQLTLPATSDDTWVVENVWIDETEHLQLVLR